MHSDEPRASYNPDTFTAEPPQRGWFARNWLWFIPLVIVLPILICAGCCTGVLAVVGIGMKSSEPYAQALAAVQEDPQVREAIGEPIEDATWFPTGEINFVNDQGEARFDFDVKGPKGRAHVRTESRMIDGVWSMVELIVTIDATGERIGLDAPEAEGVDDAPLWEP